MTDHQREPATKFIDMRVSVTWLIVVGAAVVSSYAFLQADVSAMKNAIADMKHDRAEWLAQTAKIDAELRQMSAVDAVQSNRLSTLESDMRRIRERVEIPYPNGKQP